jgi:hypothetical protein
LLFLVACISCCTDQKWSNSKAPAPSIPVSIQPLEIPVDPKSIQFGESRKSPWIHTHGGVKKPIAAAANKWSLDASLASVKLMELSERREEGLLVGYRCRAFGWGLRRRRMDAVLTGQFGTAP